MNVYGRCSIYLTNYCATDPMFWTVTMFFYNMRLLTETISISYICQADGKRGLSPAAAGAAVGFSRCSPSHRSSPKNHRFWIHSRLSWARSPCRSVDVCPLMIQYRAFQLQWTAAHVLNVVHVLSQIVLVGRNYKYHWLLSQNWEKRLPHSCRRCRTIDFGPILSCHGADLFDECILMNLVKKLEKEGQCHSTRLEALASCSQFSCLRPISFLCTGCFEIAHFKWAYMDCPWSTWPQCDLISWSPHYCNTQRTVLSCSLLQHCHNHYRSPSLGYFKKTEKGQYFI